MKLILMLSLLCVACVPKIYVIDRQTVLDDEAAGEWPDFEKDLVAKAEKKSPSAEIKSRPADEKRKTYRVLNGDMVSEAK